MYKRQNQSQFNRLNHLLKQAKHNDQIIFGGDCNESEKRISPTLIKIENRNDQLMKEELFGPLLPILCIKNLDEAISDFKSLPKPLALYLFGGKEKEQKKILSMTSSGGICFNDVIVWNSFIDYFFIHFFSNSIICLFIESITS